MKATTRTLPNRKQWSSDDVEAALRLAMVVLRATERPDHLRLNHLRSAWPAAPATEEAKRMAYGYNPLVPPPIKPTAADLQVLDAMLGATMVLADAPGLPSDARQIVLAKVANYPWRVIRLERCRTWGTNGTKGGRSPIPGGNSDVQLRNIYRRALQFMAGHLEEIELAKPDIHWAE